VKRRTPYNFRSAKALATARIINIPESKYVGNI
jgi:hypothetical protein